MINLRTFVFTALVALVTVHAEVNYIDHDQVEPFAQPEPKTDSDKAAVKYKPLLAISFGCYPYPAVQADGAVSAGLKGTGPIDGECLGSALGSQVYARSGWYKDTWAIMYAWYLPKGLTSNSQHRHFWEAVVVWIDDPARTNSTLLGVTINLGLLLERSEAPVLERFLDGSSVKLEQFNHVYHKRSKPRLQFTERKGHSLDLITWDQLTAEARDALSNADFDVRLIKVSKREMPLKDGVFEEMLEDAWPF